MAVLSTLKHHGSYDRTCLIYDNLCLYITPTYSDENKLFLKVIFACWREKAMKFGLGVFQGKVLYLNIILCLN